MTLDIALMNRSIRLITVILTILIFWPVPLRADDSPRKTAVELHGVLAVQGNRVVDASGKPYAPHGMCLFISQWIWKYYNTDALKWLRDDWHCEIIRVPLGVENDGYLAHPQAEQQKIETVVKACIDLGMYVIIDWHDDHANLHVDQSREFFAKMAETYGRYPNVIFETWNEPVQVKWESVIKPYHEAVIPVIRAHSSNLIICGTPTWSQDVDIAAKNPLSGSNIAYALHFYAATHKQSLRNKAKAALDRGAAIFVTEWGICESTGNGKIDWDETQKWLDFMSQNQIGWCNFSIGDKNEACASLVPGAPPRGGWTADMLTTDGKFIRDILRKTN